MAEQPKHLPPALDSKLLSWLSPIRNAAIWLWRKLWAWEPLAWIVGTICLPVGIVLAEEQMYALARVLIISGSALLEGKVLHDAIITHKPAKEILAASLISSAILAAATVGGWWIVDKIEWRHEVIIKMTFKSSPVLNARRQEQITWELNEYYLYLIKLGFDLPATIPPLDLSPPHGPMLGGGSEGPPYYSSLVIPEDAIDNPDMVRLDYSAYTFNRMLVWPDRVDPRITRPQAQNDEVAAWIVFCYFPASFSGHLSCARDAPGGKWTEALWEIRREHGQNYVDTLMCYTLKMWNAVPSKYIDSFDRYFRYKLTSGMSQRDR